MLTKADILNAVKLRHEDVEVAEWGGAVRISEMTAGAYDRYQKSLYKIKGGKVEQDFGDMMTAYIQACIVDGKGAPMFELNEVKMLPAKIIMRLYDVALRVNGDSVEERKEIEKNSEGGQDE